MENQVLHPSRHPHTGQFLKLPVVLLARPDLTATAKLVLAYLIDRSGLKGVAWPSVRRIAGEIGVGERAVRRAVHQLTKSGDLSIEPRLNGARNNYQIHMESAAIVAAVLCAGGWACFRRASFKFAECI